MLTPKLVMQYFLQDLMRLTEKASEYKGTEVMDFGVLYVNMLYFEAWIHSSYSWYVIRGSGSSLR